MSPKERIGSVLPLQKIDVETQQILEEMHKEISKKQALMLQKIYKETEQMLQKFVEEVEQQYIPI